MKRGTSIVAAGTWGANSSRAGSISVLCQAPATLSGTTRLAPAAMRQLARDPHRLGVAADDDLARGVEVGELHPAGALVHGLGDRGAQRFGLQAQHRRHRALGWARPRGASPSRAG